MNICLLCDPGFHPVLDEVVVRLAGRHRVSVRNASAPSTPANDNASDRAASNQPAADVVLLKSRSDESLRVARAAERAGAVVINTPGATAASRDRVAIADRLARNAVPSPRTWSFDTLDGLAEATGTMGPLTWPLVVKSRYSRRGDLVRLLQTPAELVSLLPKWHAEPVVAQEFAVNDGRDIKLWVIDGQITAAHRPSALDGKDTGNDVPLLPGELPGEWARAGLDAGAALGLELFGVDLVISGGQPFVVDVNAFPGFRSAGAAAASIARFVERIADARKVCA